MVKRCLAAGVLLVAIGCGDASPPTSHQPASGSPFGGAAALPRASVLIDPETSDAVETVDPSALTVTGSITFNDLGTASTNYDGIVSRRGGSFAERFAGQIVSFSGDHDVLSGTPTSSLSLQVGAPNQNINTVYDGASDATVIDGLGPMGYPNANAIGEGALALLFDEDQAELGVTINGADAGTATVNFFRQDGSLIQTIVLQLASIAGRQSFGFRRAGGLSDIAGVSIHNDDPGGIGYPEFRIAEPSTIETTEEVPAGEPDTVTVQENGKDVAGLAFAENTFDEDVTVTVRLKELEDGETCHDFLLGQTGRCLEITVKNDLGQDADLKKSVTVGVCLSAPEPAELYKFDDRAGLARPLRQVAADFLECEGFQTSSTAPRNWFEGLAMGLSKRVGKWISPKLAYAADGGFGGEVHSKDGFSFFTWASPIQIARAGLAINVFNSGKDGFGIDGTFDLQPKDFAPFLNEAGFDPAAHAVTVAYGDYVETIPAGKFIWSNRVKRYAFSSSASVGVNYMDIDPQTGAFRLAGRAPTEGDALPTYRPFTVQIGHRVKGGGLFCGSDNRCALEH